VNDDMMKIREKKRVMGFFLTTVEKRAIAT
jgi:hypothetical protein